MRSRSYGQYCPIAHALDIVGDRWTLLVLRELSFGPKRYTDLREALSGVAPNLLADRLRMLEEAGVVTKEDLPPPAARTVYVLTDAGREVRPVLAALARFGARQMPPPPDGTRMSPRAALAAGVTAFHDPLAGVDVDERYRIVIDGHVFDLHACKGRLRSSADDHPPDLVIEAPASVLIQVRHGETTLTDAARDHRAVKVEGTPTARRHFHALFGLPMSSTAHPAEERMGT